MFSTLRTRFGLPGVIATVALVFAMAGGAFAAKYLITSTSQIKPSVLKKLKGATGPQGPQGPQGPAGPAGASGKDGAPGADGKSVTVAAIAEEEEECEGRGGAMVQEKGALEGVEVCNGAEGPLVDTLPGGESLTGTWGFTGAEAVVTISYQFRLSSALPEGDIVFVKPSEDESTSCPGTEANPLAAKGKLCLYSAAEETAYLSGFGFPHSTVAGVSTYMTGEGFGLGTWALTAP
jgi:hypothetical protein